MYGAVVAVLVTTVVEVWHCCHCGLVLAVPHCGEALVVLSGTDNINGIMDVLGVVAAGPVTSEVSRWHLHTCTPYLAVGRDPCPSISSCYQ